ncbi:NAD(P)-binding domain-containing protein [Enterococcus faecalis]|uniref:NAD(P)/FAD-dependent oxidoreductase n=1 Tax=Enterococcus faecalis TaxID=1351 RepID=UPI00232B77F6|nr:NAD(P)/FAD-dependent oxidoreductase [Enterococcus faecalis]MDB1617085.1 NAD(P)-binding domain-containing protein [Enterococcus faecalis]
MVEKKEIVIIGAGAAGVGMGVTLTELGMSDFVILEKEKVGNSFANWPQETRFITPSFTSNGFGMSDLNAVAVDTSPAYTLGKERLSGIDYAEYLQLVSDEYHLPLKTDCTVKTIKKEGTKYLIETTKGTISTKYLIFAVGEFSFPVKTNIEGADKFGLHYGEVNSWKEIEGEHQTIIGGNESAIDAALELAKLGKDVSIYTKSSGLDSREADPSIRLSPYTRQRFFDLHVNQKISGNIKIFTSATIRRIEKLVAEYGLITDTGESFKAKSTPILCTGFQNGVKTIATSLFEYKENGEALLNQFDESTVAKNVFLTGPSVRNGYAIFCYVYKFRQRFALIASEIAHRSELIIDQKKLDYYKKQSFYLEDCSSCEVSCTC